MVKELLMSEKKPDDLSIRRREIYMTALPSETTTKSWSTLCAFLASIL